MTKHGIRISIVLATLVFVILACSRTPAGRLESEVKKHLEASGGGTILATAPVKGKLPGLISSIKSEEDLAEVWNALKGNDEAAALNQMMQNQVRLIVVPIKLDQDIGRSSNILEAIVHNGELNRFSILYTDSDTIVAGPSHKSLQLADSGLNQVVTYTRQKLGGGDSGKAALPEGFDLPFVGGAEVEVQMTDAIGFNKGIGLLRGKGKTMRSALDEALGKAKPAYQKTSAASGRTEPWGEYAKTVRLTISLFREKGMLNVGSGKLNEMTAPGLDGLVVNFPKNEPPAIVISPGQYRHYKADNVVKAVEMALKLAKVDKEEWKKEGVTFEKFRTLDFIERTAGGEVVRLFRGVEYVDPAKLDKAAAQQAFREGANWLASIFDDSTRMFKYTYFAMKNSFQDNRYNLIRHGLATLTLIQAYELFKEENFLKKARMAIEWQLDLLEWEGKMAYFHHDRFDKKYKLGGAGVLVQAMAEYQRFEKRPEWEKPIKGLAEFMMRMQEANGHYRSIYTKEGEKEDTEEITIYPGEVNLALVRLYHLNKDKRYLETVSKAFKYYSKWFNEKKSNKSKGDLGPYVPWEMSAMMEYWEITKLDDVAEYAYQMADWLIDNWFISGPGQTHWKDYVGGYKNGQSKHELPIWNSGVYAEGVVSVYQLAKLRRDQPKTEKYRKATILAMRFIRQSQYREGSSYYLPEPAKAIGCIPSNFFEDDCRLDFAYHCLTVDYRALRFFAEEEWQGQAK